MRNPFSGRLFTSTLHRFVIAALAGVFVGPQAFGADPVSADASAPPVEKNAVSIYVIPVKTAIGKPTLYAIRGGLKQAIDLKADIVVLDMETPGGELGATLDIMQALDKFPGKTVTYVNEEATSAGAIIAAVTNEIYFTSHGVMGSAEPVTGQGQDIDESMKRKVLSYLTAKIRTYTADYRYRTQVIEAMVDPSVELKIDDVEIIGKGELLNLTGPEAVKEYGDPPEPLLGAGIHETLDELVASLANGASVTRNDFEVTWSLDLAVWLMMLNPVLLGLAGFFMYLEFQTQGFGLYFSLALAFAAIAFFGHNVAGLSGNEAMLVFIAGAVLVLLEIYFMPGALILAIPGILLMLGSLLYGMADIWPEGSSPNYEFTLDLFFTPLLDLIIAGGLSVLMMVAFVKFMPRKMVLNRMILSRAIDKSSRYAGPESEAAEAADPKAGDVGVVVSDLMPGGEVEFQGRRYQAQIDIGSARRGEQVRVVRKGSFDYVVEVVR